MAKKENLHVLMFSQCSNVYEQGSTVSASDAYNSRRPTTHYNVHAKTIACASLVLLHLGYEGRQKKIPENMDCSRDNAEESERRTVSSCGAPFADPMLHGVGACTLNFCDEDAHSWRSPARLPTLQLLRTSCEWGLNLHWVHFKGIDPWMSVQCRAQKAEAFLMPFLQPSDLFQQNDILKMR